MQTTPTYTPSNWGNVVAGTPLRGKEYIWAEGDKYYWSTAPYRQYGVEITFEEFAAKTLEGVEEALPSPGQFNWSYITYTSTEAEDGA